MTTTHVSFTKNFYFLYFMQFFNHFLIPIKYYNDYIVLASALGTYEGVQESYTIKFATLKIRSQAVSTRTRGGGLLTKNQTGLDSGREMD